MFVISKLITRQYRLPIHHFLKNRTRYNSVLIINFKSAHNSTQFNVPLEFTTLKRKLHSVKSELDAMALSPLDPSSYSRPELAVVKHVDLKLNVDFEKKQLSGEALLTVNVLDSIEELILDSSNLTIESIESEDGRYLNFTLDDPVPNYGSKLTIPLPEPATADQKKPSVQPKIHIEEKRREVKQLPSEPMMMTFNGLTYQPVLEMSQSTSMASTVCVRVLQSSDSVHSEGRHLKIRIKYKTSPSATALQWLEPKQTSGKKYPYMFSQCQPIHARSILPCQDSPSVKFTYNAEVTAPEPFTVLMSAIKGNSSEKATFRQPVPIPSYLLAIAVAVLESRELGPRSHVWSEKEEIDRSAWEFADTEKYLQAAERLCGPYQWTQYDLLVLPPSFPYGGMENPCLTFVTPTLLAGDKSQADVIVHEIMHSWTGNLVTNRNFEHFWLNEGFTVFLERKVGASLIADKEEAHRRRDFSSLLGLQELTETINQNLGPTSPLTQLVPDLNNTHPDDAFSRVPYEKGSLFLRCLEDLVGGPEVFDDFLRSYLDKFQRQSIDTDQFKAYLLDYYKDNEALKVVDWTTWLHKSGMPPVIPAYDTSMTKDVTVLLAKVNDTSSTLDYSDILTFTPQQIINFLQALIDQDPLPLDRLRNMGKTYSIDTSKNSEIVYRWQRLCIRSRDESKLSEALQFVNNQGRMKYVRPIYRDLYNWEAVRERAIENFLKNEANMMHVSAYTLRKDLHLKE